MVTLPEERRGKYVLLENSVDLNNVCVDVCIYIYIQREVFEYKTQRVRHDSG